MVGFRHVYKLVNEFQELYTAEAKKHYKDVDGLRKGNLSVLFVGVVLEPLEIIEETTLMRLQLKGRSCMQTRCDFLVFRR